MRFKRILLLLSVVMLVAAAVMGFFAWRDLRRAVVVVEWKTASELDTAGFNLYRSENAEGPFEKINADLIPASLDPLTGGSYTYEDPEGLPNKVYYYQLEEVQTDGGSSRFGPIEVKAVSSGGLQLAMAGLLALVGFLALYLLRS